jgi:hypothetical protein
MRHSECQFNMVGSLEDFAKDNISAAPMYFLACVYWSLFLFQDFELSVFNTCHL